MKCTYLYITKSEKFLVNQKYVFIIGNLLAVVTDYTSYKIMKKYMFLLLKLDILVLLIIPNITFVCQV